MITRISITILGLLLLSALTSNAQRERGEDPRVKKDLQLLFGDEYGSGEEMFKSTEIPEKWSNSSAVILGQKMDFKYLRKGKNIGVFEATRKRIKIQDKAGLEEFSEFYFAKDAIVTFNIIKPNGKKVEIDMSEAVVVSTNIPRVFRTYYTESNGYKKLAVAGLEVGDIIDYYYFTTDEILAAYSKDLHTFIFTLASSYPIASQSFEFTVDKGMYLSCNSYNGAAKLSEKKKGFDLSGRERETISTYTLSDSDRDELPDEIWTYNYLELPFVKFKVRNSGGVNRNTISLIGEESVAKKEVTKDELQERYMNIVNYESDYHNSVSKEIANYIRKEYRDEKDPEKLAEIAYYYYRYKVLNSYYWFENGHYTYKDDIIYVKDILFLQIMYFTMKRLAVETEFVLMMPKYLGHIKDVLMDDEVGVGIRVKGSDHVIMPFTNYSNYPYVNPNYASTDALAINKDGYVDIVVEASTPEMNYIHRYMDLSIADDFETINFKKVNTVAGDFKDDYSKVVLRSYDYLLEDKVRFDNSYKPSAAERGNVKRIQAAKEKYESEQKDEYEAVVKRLEELADDNYEIENYDRFELVQDGRFEDPTELIFEEYYTVKGLVSKAGPNYVVEIGKMLGSQVQLDQKDKSARQMDVHVSAAKSFAYTVQLAIPEGYAVDGLDQLNFNVENKYGSFKSNAKIEGNSIVLDAKKVYKLDFIPKEDWTSAYTFLEAAYDLSQTKVVLKKK